MSVAMGKLPPVPKENRSPKGPGDIPDVENESFVMSEPHRPQLDAVTSAPSHAIFAGYRFSSSS
jgi:hypothetical protein